MVPNWHEQAVVSVEISMMSQMELGSVEKVLHWRVLVGPDPGSKLQMGVSISVQRIEAYQVGTNRHPMLAAKKQERSQESRSERSNIDKMFFKVLDKSRTLKNILSILLRSKGGEIHAFFS